MVNYSKLSDMLTYLSVRPPFLIEKQNVTVQLSGALWYSLCAKCEKRGEEFTPERCMVDKKSAAMIREQNFAWKQ